MLKRLFVSIVLPGILSTVLLSASALAEKPAPGENATPPKKAGPAAKEFYALHEQLNALLPELAQLQIKYRTANDEKRSEILLQRKAIIAKGEAIEPKLVAAAKKAYAEAPNADKKITDLLMSLLWEDVQADNYEPANEIGKLLMENNCEDLGIANLAGIAAFAVSDFDAAEKYLVKAAKGGYYDAKHQSAETELAKTGAMFGQLLPYYKTIWPKEQATRDLEADARLPRVLLKTTKGDIELELFENQAPNTVANFISLVNKGFYRDVPFHRVIKGFMAQGGDPTGTGAGGPGYSIRCEWGRPDHRNHFRGTLSMAHAGQDTGGSQFFLTFVPTPHLDGKHTVFGRVVAGMDVLSKLQRRDADDKEAVRADKILDAKVIRSRKPPEDYRPEKI